MSRYVRLCAIAPEPPQVNPSWDMNHVVDFVIEYWERWLSNVLPEHPDLIALPEVCDRPRDFTYEQILAFYEARENRIRDYFSDVAKKEKVNIAYSSIRDLSDGTRYNSTQFINRKGEIDGIYNKNYLIREEFTEIHASYGSEQNLIKTDIGTVGGAICFDLNFAPLREAYKKQHPDLLVFCAQYHGGLMQNYWAYDCSSYFLGAVTTNHYGRWCSLIDPVGKLIAQSTNYYDYLVEDVNLDCKVVHLDYNWDILDKIKARYGRKIKISDPGQVANVLISNESDDLDLDSIIREYGIELWEDYYARSIRYHDEANEKQ